MSNLYLNLPLMSWKVAARSTCATVLGDALKHFWLRAAKGEHRLGLLKQYARILVHGPQQYARVRRARRFTRPTAGGTCWACQRNTKKLVCHHIVQVQHGGRNVLKNLVWLCKGCHAEIHPWLAKRAKIVAPEFDAAPRLVRRSA